MKEELFVSGRDIPFIDPVLHIWHWQIPLYLFVGGLAAGLIFFASYFYLKGKEDKFPIAVKVAPFLAPIVIVLGLIALIRFTSPCLFLAIIHNYSFRLSNVVGSMDAWCNNAIIRFMAF